MAKLEKAQPVETNCLMLTDSELRVLAHVMCTLASDDYRSGLWTQQETGTRYSKVDFVEARTPSMKDIKSVAKVIEDNDSGEDFYDLFEEINAVRGEVERLTGVN